MEEVLNFLNNIGIKNISEDDKKIIAKMLNKNDSFQVMQELDFLNNLNKILVNQYGKVSIENMNKINESIDGDTIVKLFIFYNGIKSRCFDEEDLIKEFKSIVEKILNVRTATTKTIVKEVKKSIKSIENFKEVLYLTMEDKEKVDQLLDNCVNRIKNFVNRCDIDNMQTLVSFLKENYDFTDQELVDVSSKCATLFVESSVNKIINIVDTLENFKTFISSRMLNGEQGLLNRNIKDILMASSTIMSKNPKQIQDTVRFLSGEKISDITDAGKEIGEIKGVFTPLELAKIYNEAITSLAVSVDKIADISYNIAKSYENVFKEKLSYDGLINGRNFSSLSQLVKEDYLTKGKIDKIFETLSMFISKDDMVSLLKNDFSFLIASYEDVQKSLKDAVINSKNEMELKKNVLKKINNHFDIYEGIIKFEGAKKNKIQIGSADKIKIKDFSEGQIDSVLDALSANDSEKEVRKNNWQEEIELKNLEIELALEGIIEQLGVVKEFLYENVVDINDFINNCLENKQLLVELKEKYLKVVSENDFNSRLEDISGDAREKLNDVIDVLNDKFDYIIGIYLEEMNKLTSDMQVLIGRKNDYINIENKRDRIKKELQEQNISETLLIQLNEKIAEGYALYNRAKSCYSRTCKEQDDITVRVYKLCMRMEAHNMEGFFESSEDYKNDLDVAELFVLFFSLLRKEGWLMEFGFFDMLHDFMDGEYQLEKEIDRGIYDELQKKVLSVEERKMMNDIIEDAKRITIQREEFLTKIGQFIGGKENERSIKLMEMQKNDDGDGIVIDSTIKAFKKYLGLYEAKIREKTAPLDELNRLKRRLELIEIESIEEEISNLNKVLEEYVEREGFIRKNKIKKI